MIVISVVLHALAAGAMYRFGGMPQPPKLPDNFRVMVLQAPETRSGAVREELLEGSAKPPPATTPPPPKEPPKPEPEPEPAPKPEPPKPKPEPKPEPKPAPKEVVAKKVEKLEEKTKEEPKKEVKKTEKPKEEEKKKEEKQPSKPHDPRKMVDLNEPPDPVEFFDAGEVEPMVVAEKGPMRTATAINGVPPALVGWGNKVKRKVESIWQRPDSLFADIASKVEVVFTVDAQGNLVGEPFLMAATTDQQLAASGILAIKQSAPYPPLPAPFTEQQVVYEFQLMQ